MKRLLLMAGILAATNLCAQEFQPDINKLIARSKLYKPESDTVKPQWRPYSFDMKTLVPETLKEELKKEPGVYALPQDGMPCIVPDTKGIAAMPNPTQKTKVPPANRIPNAAPKQHPLPPSGSWSK